MFYYFNFNQNWLINYLLYYSLIFIINYLIRFSITLILILNYFNYLLNLI